MVGQPVGLRHGVRWLPHSGLGHVLGPCAYERRPEKALTLPDELWSRNESWMRDFFEQETSDFLCLGVVSRRTNIRFVEGGGARG